MISGAAGTGALLSPFAPGGQAAPPLSALPSRKVGSTSRAITSGYRGETHTFSPIVFWRGKIWNAQGIQWNIRDRSSLDAICTREPRGSTAICTQILPEESWSPKSADTGLQAHRRNNLQPKKGRAVNTRDNQMAKGKCRNISNRNQGYLATSEPSSPTTEFLDTTTHWKSKSWI